MCLQDVLATGICVCVAMHCSLHYVVVVEVYVVVVLCAGCSTAVTEHSWVLLLDWGRLLIHLLLAWKWRPPQEERA